MSLVQDTNIKALTELDALSAEYGESIAYDISDVIGVLVGIKPVAMIGNNSSVPDIGIDLIERLGLKYASWPEKKLTYVSYYQDKANRLAELHKIVWGKNSVYPKENMEIGALLGYPETASKYFIERLKTMAAGTSLPQPQSLPEEIRRTVSVYFCNLILSPEHYKEELRSYCQPLEEAVRDYAPRTYETFCALSSRS